MTKPAADAATLSIGDLAEATGLSVETIRIWERRYGRPVSYRLPSGHRRYSDEQAHWLCKVAEALSNGARASEAVRATDDALAALLPAVPPRAQRALDDWIDALRAFDGPTLRSRIRREASARAPQEFVTEVIAPLLVGVGRAWAEGRLDIRHEHHLSQLLAEELDALRGSLPSSAAAPSIVFATLPCERHELGLAMAAFVGADAGARCIVLGADTPASEIVGAAREAGAAAVAISISAVHGGRNTERAIAALRTALPAAIRLFVGGAGSRRRRRRALDIEQIEDFREFADQVRTLTTKPQAPTIEPRG